MNKHAKFWLAFFNIYSIILILIGVVIWGQNDFTYRPYLVFAVPMVFYLVAQFIINYFNLTENEDK